MIEANHPRLSVVRQCELVSIARSSHYYAGKGESALKLKLMRLIDEQFLTTPWYGSRQMARSRRRQGYGVGRKRIRRLMRQMGSGSHLPEAENVDAPSSASDLSVSAAACADRSAEPGVVRRYHVHPDATRLPVFGGDHGLGDAHGALLALVEHTGQ